MGVTLAALAIGGAAIGGASGFLGSQGAAQQAQAQYLANKVQVERGNFENAMRNDKQNFATARQNAMRRWNNRKIEESAVKTYADTIRSNQEAFQTNSQNFARNMISNFATMEARATGKNIRGGMNQRFQALASESFSKERATLRKNKFRADTNTKAVYENTLNQRDLLSYGDASIFMPGSSGVKPGAQTLSLLSGMLGGAVSGASAGAGIANAGGKMSFEDLGNLF